jgi:hypothetical protein
MATKNLCITDGKGFGMQFANGWCVSVQWGYGNYCDNYDGRGGAPDEEYTARNRRLGAQGSNTAECAVFAADGEMTKLPAFMFDDNDDFRDVVSNRSTPEQVLQLLSWAASQDAV